MKKRMLILGMASTALLAGRSHNVHSSTVSVKTSASQSKQSGLVLHKTMRKLWTDQVSLTRNYIVATISNDPDTEEVTARLLENQEDIGNDLAKYYGKEAGDKLTGLLKQHILIAVDLINAAKANNQARFSGISSRWKHNGQEIADFLSSTNSHWPRATMRDMMNKHLSTTVAEVSAGLNKDDATAVKAFADASRHILMMADALSVGIIKQFPAKF